jgi:hypothetical protein
MAAASAVETAPRTELRLGAAWIGSPGWDAFWMFSALWGAALLLAGGLFVEVTVLATALFLLNRFVSIAHSWSTTYMVLFSPLLRAQRRSRPTRFVRIPLAITALSFGLGLGVAGWQRFPADGAFHAGLWVFALYIGLFWIGHFWHFGNQDFGVLTLYRIRAGQLRPFDRAVDKAYTVAMMFVIQPVVYLSIVRTTAFAEMAYTWLPFTPQGLWLAARVAVTAATLLTLGVLALELSRPNRSLPKLLYYGVCWLHAALLFGVGWTREPSLAFLYVMAYMWSHWFIAIGLVSRINSAYYRSRGDSGRRAWVRHAVLLGGIALGVWLLTLNYAEFGLFNTDGFAYKAILAGIGPGQVLLLGGVLGFFLAEQLLHYYCDRCLFRFRDAGVREKVAPLLIGVK